MLVDLRVRIDNISKSTVVDFKKSSNTQRGLFAFLSVCFVFILSACASKDVEMPVLSFEPETEQAVEQETPSEGGVLSVPIPYNTQTLNPLLADTMQLQEALSLCYEPMVRYDATRRLSPVLAESWEKVDETGKQWRIYLRQNVLWQGTNDIFSADDIIFTFELLQSDAYAKSNYAETIKKIESIEKESEFVIIMTAVEPGEQMLHSLLFPIVSEKHFHLQEQPVGTGPYRMMEAHPKVGVVFESNEKWWKKPPLIKTVVAKSMASEQASLGALEMSALNFAPTKLLTAARYRDQGHIAMIDVPSQQCEMILINHKNPILQDVAVRKAIAYAIDPKDMITRIYLNHGFATDVPIPPDSYLYNPATKVFDAQAETAVKLLEEAGWKDKDGDGILDKDFSEGKQSLKFRLLVNDTPENQVRKDAAELVKVQLLRVGIDIEIFAAPWSSTSDEYAKLLREGAFDLAMAGFYLDESGDLRPYLSQNGNRNYGQYQNKQMETLLADVTAATDEKQSKSAMDALQHYFVDDIPFIQLFFRTMSIGYNETLRVTQAQDIRFASPFVGIEKWYFSAEGRKRFEATELTLQNTDWTLFDSESAQQTDEANPDGTPEGTEAPQKSEVPTIADPFLTPDAAVSRKSETEDKQTDTQ